MISNKSKIIKALNLLTLFLLGFLLRQIMFSEQLYCATKTDYFIRCKFQNFKIAVLF